MVWWILFVAFCVVGYLVAGGLTTRVMVRLMDGKAGGIDEMPWAITVTFWPVIAVVALIGTMLWLPAKLAWFVYPSQQEEDKIIGPAPERVLVRVVTLNLEFRDGTKQTFEKASTEATCNNTWLRISHGNTVSTVSLADIKSIETVSHGETVPANELR